MTFNTNFQDIMNLMCSFKSFKPCYKWMTFNTMEWVELRFYIYTVLNLVINGWPSIHKKYYMLNEPIVSFKPRYKWMTFNTGQETVEVDRSQYSFKPRYKWMTFNTLTKGINVIFMLERSLFYMVAKFEHFSVIHGFLTFYIKFLLQFFCFFLK